MASVMDLCSCKIIGYASYGTFMTAELAAEAVKNTCIEFFHSVLKKEGCLRIRQTSWHWPERLDAKEILDRLALELAHEQKRESIWERVRDGSADMRGSPDRHGAGSDMLKEP